MFGDLNMHTKFITFARASSAVNIVDSQVKNMLIDTLRKKYGEEIPKTAIKEFDGNDFKKLENKAHLAATRSQGNPYFLYLTVLNFKNTCIFIDKKVIGEQGHLYPRMLIVHLAFDDSLFSRETLIGGEMVKTKTKDWLFLISDLIGIDSARLNKTNLVRRLHILYEIFESQFEQDPDLDPCDFQIKQYKTYDQLRDLSSQEILYSFTDDMKNKSGGTQIQKSASSPKSTQSSNKTVFSVAGTEMPDLYYLYSLSSNSFIGYACVPSKTTSFLLQNTFASKSYGAREARKLRG